MATEWSVAHCLSREETIRVIEEKVLELLQTIADERDPVMTLVSRTESNTIRDINGTIRLGKNRTVKRLFAHKGIGIRQFTRSTLINNTQNMHWCDMTVWQVLSFIYKLVQDSKTVTQREAYYCLVQHFKSQTEFNNTLQDVVALTGCTRASLGICTSSCGGIAGLVMWKEPIGDWENCSNCTTGKRIPGQINGIKLKLIDNPQYIIVVEKDAVFSYLCNQRIWEHIPCIIITGCGYPPLNVRALLKQLKDQFDLPVLGLFDYNPHGVRILLTYKFGSTRMGTESHAYAVDIKWLGIHHNDLFQHDGTPLVPQSGLQSWTITDHKVWKGLQNSCNGDPRYEHELHLMGLRKLKAEIEVLNCQRFDGVQDVMIHKILSRQYY